MSNKPQYAFVHGCYVESRANKVDDAVIVKRYKINEDGSREPQLHIHKNVVRDFYVTKPAFRKFQDGKLEYEYKDRLIRDESTQRHLSVKIQRKLGFVPNPTTNLRQVCNSPFVYGVDKDICAVVGDKYLSAYPDVEPFDLEYACMDTETNVVDKSNDLIIMSFFHNKTGVVAIHESWLLDKRHTPEIVKQFIIDNVPDVQDLGMNVEVVFKPTPAECVIHVINRAHELKPDIVGFWNIDFDIPLLIETLTKEGHDPADIFSDPSIPKEFKYFKYRRGQDSKLTDSGKYKPLAPSEQWHTVLTPATFYFIDPSSTYRCLRRQKSEVSYGLEYLTTKILGEGKIKPDIEDLKALEGTLKWHFEMQRHHQLWYIAYALGDVIRPVQMDNKLGDIAKKLPVLARGSHFKDFNSNPRRLCDNLDGFFKKHNAVVGTTGATMESPLDQHIPASKDWIVTLEASIIEDTGIYLFNGVPVGKGGEKDWMRRSKLYIMNADLDIVSTYPVLGMVFNIARETVVFESCKIEGLNYYTYREFGINLTAGMANSLIIARDVINVKSLNEVMDMFERDHNIATTTELIDQKLETDKLIRRQRALEAAEKAREIANI